MGLKRHAGITDGVAFFQMGGVILGAVSARRAPRRIPASPSATAPSRVYLAYNTRSEAEVDAVLALAEAAGGTHRQAGAAGPSGAAGTAISPTPRAISGKSRTTRTSRSMPKAGSRCRLDWRISSRRALAPYLRAPAGRPRVVAARSRRLERVVRSRRTDEGSFAKRAPYSAEGTASSDLASRLGAGRLPRGRRRQGRHGRRPFQRHRPPNPFDPTARLPISDCRFLPLKSHPMLHCRWQLAGGTRDVRPDGSGKCGAGMRARTVAGGASLGPGLEPPRLDGRRRLRSNTGGAWLERH